MNNSLRNKILTVTCSDEITGIQKIQSLWSGYGEILRVGLSGSEFKSIIVKHVKLPEQGSHPRGWNTGLSHARKIKSYHVECHFYEKWRAISSSQARTPQCLGNEIPPGDNEILIILEDLNSRGYTSRKNSVNRKEMDLCLQWLARFHASYMGKKPEGLWKTGTYWHLETRPDELEVLEDQALKKAAWAIDQELKSSPFQTLVHGDAKLANFCFMPDSSGVAAVDFQYIGGGCGIKDVAYFMGSCLYEQECEAEEERILGTYFKYLEAALKDTGKTTDFKKLEENWRELYPVAWTDFHRFLKGWSPGHWKINSYSERLSREVIGKLEASGKI